VSGTIVFYYDIGHFSIQLAAMFRLVGILCKNGGTSDVMVESKDTFVHLVVPHPISKANYTTVSKVQPKSWHEAMAKFHDLLT
jgi:hypothetical protein